MSTESSPDPYDLPPPWWQRHVEPLTALAVFIATVVLTVVSFPPYQVPEFAYALAAPAVFWAYRRPAFKLYAGTVLGACAVAWTIVLGWLHHVTWAGLFLLGPFVGVWVGVWFLAAWWLMPRLLGRGAMERIAAVFGLAGLWVLIEWTRTWFLSGFPWLTLATSQWQRVSILQIAAFTGGWGVSFVLIAMNISFAAYAHRLLCEGRRGLQRRSQEFFACLFLLIVCVTVHVQESFNRGRYAVPLGRVAFTQPYIPQSVKWEPSRGQEILETLERTTMRAASSRPDLILWPEATTPWAVLGDARVRGWAEALAKRAKTPLLMGSIAVENQSTPNEAWYNGAFVVEPLIGLRSVYYAKRQLVPFGEYVPLRPVLGWLEKVVPVGGDFQRGQLPVTMTVTLGGQPVAVAPLICYEDVFPALARDSVRAGADVLTVLTNSAWYGEGGAAYQHAAHSVLRAVETRRPVLRCGNGGWSGWIDEFGNVRSVVTNGKGSIYARTTQTVDITRDARWIGQQSFYVRYGDWFVALCAALVAFGYAAVKLGRPVETVPAEENAEG
ncbi:MAG: apolipoprotein N-acyltransferase [Opitutae bacterium]|nr:apolipoprotein N-acyltransferase [Opitutae bacterium]